MSRTITAFYETRAQAEKARDALKAAHLGRDVDILDQSAADAHPTHPGFVEWLGGLFDGHSDKHVFGEGLRRGHFLVTAKVDDVYETRAAEVMEAANPLDLDDAQQAWTIEGWTQPRFVEADHAEPRGEEIAVSVTLIGPCIRSYRADGVAEAT